MQLTLPHGFKRWNSIDEVRACQHMLGEEWRGQQAFQKLLLENAKLPQAAGYCAVCENTTIFTIAAPPEGEPNWRESVVCAGCGLINRWRASLHLNRMLDATTPAGAVYITEQTTPVYQWLIQRLPGLIGSEYVAATAVSGATVEWNTLQLRHEDITRLSMADASLARVLTFDVLEHVPDYRAALTEFARVLMPGGLLLLTAPFLFESQDTLTRATVNADGSLTHHQPALYHGDPLQEGGVLCYQEFGWDLLDAVRAAGFAHAEIITCWAPDMGYYGSFQPFIVAWR
jgi:SAM-dependent methyltransferase